MTDPEEIKKLLLQVIRDRTDNHPRSLQKAIGPSEIGHPCDRWMVYKLGDSTPGVGGTRDKWLATIGTFVHAGLAEWFGEFNDKIGMQLFHVEERVEVGSVYEGDGHDVSGGCDLFVNKVVVDWKIVGKTTLDKVKRAGHPGPKYRKQGHSYGRGWVRAGKEVEHVAVFFLPRNGPLTDAVWWTEPYDESVVTEALDRVGRVNALVQEHGIAKAAELSDTDASECIYCSWWRPGSTDLAKGCPGVIRPSAADSVLPLD